jgi:hypothetical protein
MIDSIDATFQDGVFKPDEPPAISERTRVRLHFEPLDEKEIAARRNQAWSELRRLWQHSTFNSHGDRMTRDQLHERD